MLELILGLLFVYVRILVCDIVAERAMPITKVVPVITILKMHNLVDVAAMFTYLDFLFE